MSAGRDRADDRTPDLWDGWEPDTGEVGYDDRREIRASSIDATFSRAVAAALKAAHEDGLSRADVARAMSEYLGESVTENMLNNYASQAKEDHKITPARLAALVHATGDRRPLSIIPELFGLAVIDSEYLYWVEVGQLEDERARLDQRLQDSRRRARKVGRKRR